MASVATSQPAKRKLLRRRAAAGPKPVEAPKAPALVSVSTILFGALVAWRSLPLSGESILPRLGLSVGLAISAGALLVLALRYTKTRLLSFFSPSRLALGALLAAAAAASSAVDLLSGRSALALVCGSIFLSLLYWDRPKYLFALLGFDLLAAAAALAEGGLGARFIQEEAALVVAAVGVAVATALTVRGIVAPGDAKLRSLEMENRELWDLSFRDGLTKLYNRRFAEETGQKLFARATRYHESFHVLMLDIDHFKRVNDRVGHAAGDEVLREIAAILQSCVRASDVASRYGGEEFVVFLVEASPETAQFIANRIRDDVAAHRFEVVPWQVTISVGIASLEEGESLAELVDRADKRLYVAKRSGRNRVFGF